MIKTLSWLKRFLILQLGLLLVGLGMALLIKSRLGVDPWTVFHMGAAKQSNISIGILIQLTGFIFILISWIALKKKIGIGCLCNMLLVGPWLEFFLLFVPSREYWLASILQFLAGLIIFGFATALYITADMGEGPRDGFVLAMAERTNISIRKMRLGIELIALTIGFLLGGPAGIGTVFFALAIGPLMQFFLQFLRNKTQAKALPED